MENRNLQTLWLAQKFVGDHPDLPPIASVRMMHHIHAGTAAERVAEVEAVAAAYGVAVQRADGSVWCTLPVATHDGNGVDVTFTVQTRTVERF